MKEAYHDFLPAQIAILGYYPGDVLELRITNEVSTESPLTSAQRVANMFFRGTLLYPTSIALHPAHLTAIRMQGKMVKAELDKGMQETCPFEGLPSHAISWEADEGLDLCTVAARFIMDKQVFTDMMIKALTKHFGGEGKKAPI